MYNVNEGAMKENTSLANDTDWSIWSVFVVVRVALSFLLNGVKADVR